MSELTGDLLSLFGLTLTLIGAGITGRAVILSEDDVLAIGLPRFAGEDRKTNLKMPMVRNLLWASFVAKWGLIFIALGTALQAAPIAIRLFQ